MYKLMYNNMVIDLLKEIQYVRYMKNSKRWINTDGQSANGVMSSDHSTIYHILGRTCPLASELKTVEIVKIDATEYSSLETQFAIQRQENDNIRNEIASLKEQLETQNNLLEAILAKLS